MDEIEENFNLLNNTEIIDLGLLNNTAVNQNNSVVIGSVSERNVNTRDLHFFSLDEPTNVLIDASVTDSSLLVFAVIEEANDDGILDRDNSGVANDGILIGTGTSDNPVLPDDLEIFQQDLSPGDYYIDVSAEATSGEEANGLNVDYTLEITPTPLNSDNSIDNEATDDTEESEPNLDLFDNTVYRFFNNNAGVHFYTASEIERDAVQELDNFSFEGASYLGVDPLTGQVQPVPVYRFLNQDTGVHLYTVSEIERDAVEELDNFSFEGEAFFAYDGEVEGSIPIYRFFNSTTGAHFYTPSAAERDSVEENLTDFASEGIAYYALPLEE